MAKRPHDPPSNREPDREPRTQFAALPWRRDANGEEPWACCDCDCTARLEAKLAGEGEAFLDVLQSRISIG